MKLATAALLGLVAADDATYIQHLAEFGISYATREEYEFRKSVFENNVARIEAHNSDPEASFEMGLNHMSDWTDAEFEYLLGDISELEPSPEPEDEVINMTAIDWRKKGGVSPVKNQGHCGSCWSFSATGQIESSYLVHKKQKVSLSEQQLVSCANKDGCGGGDKASAMRYTESHPLTTESDYKYDAKSESCNHSKESHGKYKARDVKHLASGNNGLYKGLQTQPVSVSVKADTHWHQYKSGVMKCPASSGHNHAILAVGWGSDSQGGYWIVKNSWGTGWGEKGYIRLRQDHDCNVTTSLYIATV